MLVVRLSVCFVCLFVCLLAWLLLWSVSCYPEPNHEPFIVVVVIVVAVVVIVAVFYLIVPVNYLLLVHSSVHPSSFSQCVRHVVCSLVS